MSIALSYRLQFIINVHEQVVAYTEFKGTNSKLSRYSSTVHSLQELLMWWLGDAAADRSLRGGQRGLLGADVGRAAAQGAAGSQAAKMLQKTTSANRELE